MAFGLLVQSHAPDERFGDGAQGWNIDQLAGLTGRSLVQLLRQHGTRSGSGTVCLGTLLGPEGTGGSHRATPRTPGHAPDIVGGVATGSGQHPSSNGRHQPVRVEPGSGLPPVP